ncbi:MAG: GrdX family protein [Filifactoraceae bacterium]
MLITNNPHLTDLDIPKVFVDGESLNVLLKTRDYVHKGHTLINSPLGASIRMIMSPIKTIIVSDTSSSIHQQSLMDIEAALEKHQLINLSRGEDLLNYRDYSSIDKELLLSALNEANIIRR